MNLLDLIRSDGGELKKAAMTNGGEYAGPCPFCGGRDRFRVWPGSGRYWCRGCDKAGDSIQYLRDKRGLSFQDACSYLGHDPGPRSGGPRPAPAAWKPKDKEAPGELWQKNARSFLDGAIKNLWAPAGASVRQWLNAEKSLSNDTIKKAMLGYAPEDLNASRAFWGLPEGENDRLWLPAGLVIPFLQGDNVHRLRIRRENPGDGQRYIVVSGSCMAPMTWGHDKAGVVVVESEIDGLLLNQEAGDLCGVVALGSAQAKPDPATHELLKAAPSILAAMDSDEAGAKAAWQFWPETYGPKVKRWPCIKGKDPSEARKNGLNVREWIIAGLFGNEDSFERFCIMTVDGGLSDQEAIRFIQDNRGTK